MAAFGKIDEFKPEGEEWGQYTERLEHYFVANEITEEGKKKAILLSVCGGKTYKLMSNLLAPVKPGAKTFDELKLLIQNHHHPKPSEIVQRLKFNSRFRQSGETVAMYVAELRRLSEDGNFGETLETMLRDRIVCGINDDRIQRRLLGETTLTFKKALDWANAMEMATKNTADIQKQGTANPVNKVQHSGGKFWGQSQNNKTGQGTTRTGSGKTYTSPGNSSKPHGDCYRCGGRHLADDCRFKEQDCHICKKKGHIARKCKSKIQFNNPQKKGYTKKQYYLQQDSDDNVDEYGTMFHVQGQSDTKDAYKVIMQVENTPVEMEIDTGASVTILSKRTLRNLEDQGTRICMKQSQVKLKTYTGESMPVLGEATLNVGYRNKTTLLSVVFVEGTGPNLMGRDWLQTFKLDWANIFKLETSNMEGEVKAIIDAHQEVFKEGLGTVRGVKAKIYVDPEAHPRYFKPRPVPYSLKERIEKELDRLEREGTVEKVQFSEWAAPIVPIVKNDGSIRICGDYKTTVNGVSKLDNYPIPKIEDLYATLSGGKRFSKLNLSQAYQQLELDDESKKFVTINTHKGLYQYNRLPFGVSSAPGIFQRAMENLLQGIPHVLVRMDDILVTGVSQEEHLSHLREVLRRIRDAGIRLKASKCIFLVKEVVYLGHKVSEEGIQPVTEKVKAIQEMPAPTNLKELQAYLGMLNFYNRFLPNLATVLAPLHELLVKGKKWRWAKEQQTAFKKSKDLLISADVLVHFDSKEEVVLCCDASPYGVGAVLAIKMDDGAERPVGYASRTLTAAEKNYSHLEKEGLAMIFGVKKFHQYLFGNHFKMYTDHKPLLGLLKEDKKIPEMAAARIIRWALTLAAYEYTLEYREGKLNYADGLSRLPIEEKSTRTSQVPVPGEIKLVMEHLEETPVNAKKVREWTGQDPILAKVVDYVKSGWPDKNPSADMRPYYIVRKELSVEDGCLICGSRVVIPLKGHAPILETLHEGHPGTNRMKSLARGYVWWPKIDSDLEEEIRSCSLCQLNRKPPPEAPLHPWDWPNRPWGRIHIDYAGPFMGKMFLVVIDSHSKWMEAFPMKTSTSTATIEKLRVAFATHGLPEMIVSDNGSCFTSQEFDNFMKENGIRHVRSAPYHPASNGLAERAVQILKDGLKKQTDGTVEQKTSRFLLTYRITPQTTTGIAPCELLMNRRVRSRLDLVKPCLDTKVVRKQVGQKEYHDRTSKERNFTASDAVFIKNFAKGPKWLEGTIELRSGPVSYTVHLQDGRVMKRHVDHIRIRYSPDSTEVVDNYRGREMDDPRLPSVSQSTSVSPSTVLPISENPAEQIPENQFQRSELSETVSESPAILPARIRPERETKLPVKFKDYVC